MARRHRLPPVDWVKRMDHVYCCLHGICKAMETAISRGLVARDPFDRNKYQINRPGHSVPDYPITYCPWCGEKLANVRAE